MTTVATTTATRWEYMTLMIGEHLFSAKPEKKLNELGEDGWELVAVRDHAGGMAAEAYFKRPLGR